MAAGKHRNSANADGTQAADRVTLDSAFAELRPTMFALAYPITGNRADAEEIVQDAFVRYTRRRCRMRYVRSRRTSLRYSASQSQSSAR
jgi:DNA-directed RNA polymerase specialized sigma24 family protein